MKLKIAPSILSSNFAKLGEEVELLTKAHADYIHIDVMDGSFVPQMTFGPCVIKSMRKHSNLIFDAHLMVSNPNKHIEQIAAAGADIITFHAEADLHLDSTIDKIHSFGKKAGIALVPSTDESVLSYLYEKIDLILVMTVNPGFGGQTFLDSQLRKIRNIADNIKKYGREIDLQVDGGINAITAKQCVDNGANVIVAGTYIFQNHNYDLNIKELRSLGPVFYRED